jgi:4-hydroxy-tetrahydrodipicolinate reductase
VPLLEDCMEKKRPVVLAPTGYSAEQLEQVYSAARAIPVFRSGNMSLGINIVMELVRKASAVLGEGFDVEIVERHHDKKVDAPSGTALMLAEAAASALPYDAKYTFERQSVRRPRDKREIGISSVRGGTIVGDHEVIFAGHDEIIEIRPHAMSREIFAVGALRAARFLAGVQTPGLYDMSMLVRD